MVPLDFNLLHTRELYWLSTVPPNAQTEVLLRVASQDGNAAYDAYDRAYAHQMRASHYPLNRYLAREVVSLIMQRRKEINATRIATNRMASKAASMPVSRPDAHDRLRITCSMSH